MSLRSILAIACLSLLKIILTSPQKLSACCQLIHDDALYVRLATRLASGIWLGGFGNKTLAKGPGYPLWIALNYLLGMPLLLAQQLLYIGSGLVLIVALRRWVKKEVLLVGLYALFLFNPMTFADQSTRVLREGIYPALAVLVLATAAGMFIRYKDSLSRLTIWSAGLGLALSWFWLTREEGVWILPGLLLLIAGTVYFLYRGYGPSREFLNRTLICFLPFIMLFFFINAVSLINKILYGSYTVVEFKSDPFLSAYGALARVKHPHWHRYVPVPREVRNQIYQVSPAFRELKPYLEGELGKNWAVHAGNLVPPGELASGWFMWAFRDAVALAGHYKSGAAADAYYRRLAQEINTACEQGRLACSAERKTMAPPFRWEYLGLTAATFPVALKNVITFHDFSAKPLKSTGDAPSLEFFRRITHTQVTPTDTAKDLTSGAPPLRELVLLQHGDELKIKILNNIGVFYQYIVPWLFYLAVALYIINGIRIIFRKHALLFIITSSIMISFASRLLLLSYLDVTSFKCIDSTVYLGSAYPLALIFLALSIIDTWKTGGSVKSEI
ncbi:MAG: hypothetical protein ACOZF2_11810 [Thermodesulfobacteriota bacterium]